MAAVFLTSSNTAVLVLAVLPAQARNDVNWVTWALYGAPTNIVLFIGLVASIIWLYRPAAMARQPSSRRTASLALQRALLGPMSRDEKIALGVGIGLLVGFTTQPLHGMDPAWIAVLAAGVLAATRVVTVNTLRAVNWNFALLFGVLISLATVFGHTGLDRWLADRLTSNAGGLLATPAMFVVVLTLLCFAISFLVRWQAAAPLVTIALAPVASASGIHPFVVGLVAVVACNGFFLPYQSTTYLALYHGTNGRLFTHQQARPMDRASAGVSSRSTRPRMSYCRKMCFGMFTACSSAREDPASAPCPRAERRWRAPASRPSRSPTRAPPRAAHRAPAPQRWRSPR